MATNIKSPGLGVATYSSASKLESRLTSYVDKMAIYQGSRFGDETAVYGRNFTRREVLLAIPEGVATDMQQKRSLKDGSHAMNNGVNLRIETRKVIPPSPQEPGSSRGRRPGGLCSRSLAIRLGSA